MMDDVAAKGYIQELIRYCSLEEGDFSYEMQDDFNFILVSVSIDRGICPTVEDRRKMALLLDKMVPKRAGEYSWMVNFKSNGAVVDSYFGGDINSPNSGL